MAREKKSIFSWLSGGEASDNDYSFEDLETGSSAYMPPSRKISSKSRAAAAQEPTVIPPRAQEPEEVPEGELSVDVYQTATHIVIKAMIAGVKPEDLDVSITRDMVTIRGKREQHTEGGTSDFFFQELYWGAFSRTIVLPQEVEIEEAEAVEKHGLLIIRLPKMDKGRQAKLKVRSN